MSKKWNAEKHNYLIELRQSGDYTWQGIADAMTDKFDHVYTAEQCRGRWRNNRHKIADVDPKEEYGKSMTKREDGTIETDMLVELTREQLKDESFILDAHGYDGSWEIISHQYSAWQHHNKQDGTLTLYASKLRVKPKNNKISYDDLIKQVTEKTKPLYLIKKNKEKGKRLLEIPLMDMHFGVNTLDDYKKTLIRICDNLEKRVWEKVVITFGSDLMHVDNLKNTTANQTRIQDVDVLQMIDDAKTFYEHLVTKAIEQSKEVEVIYIKGNHDETTSGLLVHWLDARFPQVKVDTEIEEVKVRHWEEIFLALTHGDKGGKRAKNVLATKYPMEWANSKIREFHKGHRHHEEVKDEFGITERTLSTGAKTDQFHKDNSYEGAHQRFQLFEYSGDWLESIHYV